ncbi:transporter substrate-binding domain-containing protein [Shewanella sp. A3A]|nr:transporter substrate-binding domain-containing protein [Shewanella ferrihydritica]
MPTKLLRQLFAFATLLLFWQPYSAMAATQQLHLAIPDNYPPFYYRNDDGFGGISIDIAKQVCQQLGYQLQLTQVANMSVLLNAMAAGKYDLSPNLTASDSRSKQLLFTHTPHVYETDMLFVRADSPLTTRPALTQLAGYRIGVIAGWLYNEEFDNATYLSRVYVNDSVQQLYSLFSGQFDMLVSDQASFTQLVREQNVSNAVRPLLPALSFQPVNMAVSRAIPNAAPLVQQLDEAIAAFVKTPAYQQLLQQYGLTLPPEPSKDTQ